MTEEMREYCDLDTCRRKYVCEHFGFQLEEKCEYDHQCCDNCELKCECDMCIILRDDLAEENNLMEDSEGFGEENSKHDMSTTKTLKEMLCSYFEAENDAIDCPNGTLYTNLTDKMAAQISENHQRHISTVSIQQEYPCVTDQIACNIITIIKAVCHKN